MPDDPQLLTDIRLELRQHLLRPVYAVAVGMQRVRRKDGIAEVPDFPLVSGRDNLAQAVITRLLTPRGELAELAHPDYGSRLYELIGRPNTATNRNLVKLYILESLQAEPRIQKVLDVTVEPVAGTRDQVRVLVQVQPIGKADRVTVGPFTLEL